MIKCKTHTEEKEDNGICCQQSPMEMSIHELAKTNPTKKYRELEKIKEQYERMEKWI